jgi:cobalt-zinc-cadmium efflux system protein
VGVARRDHPGERRAVRTGLAVSTALCVIEAAGGYWTNSLALLSDAAHMVGDVAALALTLFALWMGSRAASASKTFGYYRAEILAALVNGVVLWMVVVFIVTEAWRRLNAPPAVEARGMLAIAVLGLAVNVFVAFRLHGHAAHSLSVRGAYLHVLSDALGSIGALLAAAVILATGWVPADTLASVAIAVLILGSSWSLVRESVDVLMEAVPAHVDLEELQATLEGVPGTLEVHDLHLWSLTTGHYALSAHAVVDGSVSGDETLARMAAVCAREFHVDHVTIQLESRSRRAEEPAH